MTDTNPTKNYQQEDGFSVGPLQIAAYMFAGLAMMLNIRLSYSAAPFALLRFKLPENLFSVFVRTTSSALELWCIPSMLIGNIMEQFYNHTQNEIGVHTTGITIYATDIQKKASTLKGTAKTQSTSELATTHQTDLDNSNNAQDGLEKKAELLKNKAEALNRVADAIVQAAKTVGSPLKPLEEQAGHLKTAAMGTGGSTSLYQAAGKLAQKKSGTANNEANNVIKAYESVETHYTKLMDEYNKILDKPEGAAKLTPTDMGKVTEVVKKHHEVKNTYYQMLIIFRIKNKANEFHNAATELKTKATQAQAAKAQHSPLGKLNTAAQGEMAQLVNAAAALKEEADKLDGARDSAIVQYYLFVETYYNELEAKKEFTTALEAQVIEVKAVKEKFDALKKSYENVLRLRVQELSQKAQDLYQAATALSSAVRELQQEANALKDAASNTSGSNQGLKEKADELVNAINTDKGGNDGNKAKAVITQFDNVIKKYDELANKDKYSEKLKSALAKGQTSGLDDNEQKVKNVYDAYEALNKVYEQILNFTKLYKIAQELHTAARDGDAENVIINFNAVVPAYKALDPERQSIVNADFDNLQTEFSKAIYKYKFHILTIPSIITNWLNFLTFVILLIVFVTGGDNGHVTGYYVIMAISGFVFGINMVLVYAVDYRYLPFYMAGENSFPMVTSLILYFATSIFGNRRKYNSDYLVVVIDVSIAILIALVASVLWTVAFVNYRAALGGELTPIWPSLISPIAMVIVGMGLVYSIYPGIAPGMIVPFYLIDKIEMVLLVATAFPPVIIAFLRKYAENWSPSTKFLLTTFNMGGWQHYYDYKFGATGPENDTDKPVYGWVWHFFDILIPLKIALAVVFVYSLHYRDSYIARSIINQPKMSTFLTILFYMCHEILLALGFPGMVGNGGAGGKVMLPVQYVGALLMVFLAFYSIGYITEYKRHDPSSWPTEGMTKWNSLCYWLKMASKITNKNFKQLFTTYLFCDLIGYPTPCYIEQNKKLTIVDQIDVE